ncbi:MAG: SIS domain-containing protein [Gammaproteobacteria bacterium]|nr:SIS domain-containing protein [Gammaproteobacteria bacterium]
MENIQPDEAFFTGYAYRLQRVLATADWLGVNCLAEDILKCWKKKQQVFLCGNGGSAGNAIHLANDFLYGVAKQRGGGIRAQSLSANSAVMTCLGNDVGYEYIFSEQLAVHGQAGDLLIALSGSGNSPNIVCAVEQAKIMGVKSYAIVGYNGGRCKSLADVAIHFAVDDMQVAEDLQLVVGHMLMQWLYKNRTLYSTDTVESDIIDGALSA